MHAHHNYNNNGSEHNRINLVDKFHIGVAQLIIDDEVHLMFFATSLLR
jgi:hypothetical protein